MKHILRITSLIFVLFLSTLPSLSMSFEANFEEVGLVMTLPNSWEAKYEKDKLPTGQVLQRWVRTSVVVGQFKASPGLLVVVTPLPKDSNLGLISQSVLAQPPNSVKVVAETECIKCIFQKIKISGRIANIVSPTPRPSCVPFKEGIDADCVFQSRNYLGLKIEPSWAHLFEKEAAYGTATHIVIHAIVEDKLVDLTFIFPKVAAEQIQPEIAAIASSLRKISAK